jgi:hypothetical protein
MRHQGDEFAEAVGGDAGVLVDGEGVVGGFEFDGGAFAERAGVDVGFEVEGGWLVERQVAGQPAEVRRVGLAAGELPCSVVCRKLVSLSDAQTPQLKVSPVARTGISMLPRMKKCSPLMTHRSLPRSLPGWPARSGDQ